MKVTSKKDFVEFVQGLVKELQGGMKWENDDLISFLSAMAAWTEDSDGYYQNKGQNLPVQPNWQFFCDILRASTMYE